MWSFLTSLTFKMKKWSINSKLHYFNYLRAKVSSHKWTHLKYTQEFQVLFFCQIKNNNKN